MVNTNCWFQDYIPRSVQDSGAILLPFGAGYQTLIAALSGESRWIQLICTDAAAGANELDLAVGPAGLEVQLMHFQIPALAVFGYNLVSAPIRIAQGSRISAQTTLVNATVELHMYLQ